VNNKAKFYYSTMVECNLFVGLAD